MRAQPKTLIYVAMMAQGYKAHDDLIKALAMARQQMPDLRLVLVGDGPLRPQLEAQAREAGVADAITFAGKLTHGAGMTEALDGADLFVMPSRAEGLPRALVEAMARALPAFSTDVGGVGELLPPEYLVQPNDPALFARRLVELVSDPNQLAAMSAQNLETAHQYGVAETTGRMIAFYRHIRSEAEHGA
jgi:glycosyltransferase involved in cell wall biosynthesis